MSDKFRKSRAKADPKIKTAFKKRLRLFLQDPHHPQLNNHKLSGRYTGYRSINITGDWRAVYSEHAYRHGKVKRKIITFELIGTHSQLYG